MEAEVLEMEVSMYYKFVQGIVVRSLAMEAEVLELRTKQRRSNSGHFVLSEWTWQRLLVPVK